MEDTIAAIATPPGEGAIGIVRLSGPQAIEIAQRVFHGKRLLKDVNSHTLVLGQLVDRRGVAFDEALVAVMRAPRTFTGEDVVEIHSHGGSLLVETVLRRLVEEGARPAEPGEFTKRAFINGKLDLAQAEAVIDLVRAKSPRGLQIAAGQLQGRLSQTIEEDRQVILGILAHVQALIDYPEEALDELPMDELKMRLVAVLGRIDQLQASAETGRIYQDGMRLAIVGKPNVGKSSLLNAILREDRAIVTPIAGTTRDVIEARAIIGGIPVLLFDTAGIRPTEDPVEQIGVERTVGVIESADVIVLVLDGSLPLTPEDFQAYEQAKQRDIPLLVAINKSDLPEGLSIDLVREMVGLAPVVRVSAHSGEGLEALAQEAIRLRVGDAHADTNQIVITRARHLGALKRAQEALQRAMQALEEDLPVELVGVDLQDALQALGEVTGDSVAEEVVDRIFADFCVGK